MIHYRTATAAEMDTILSWAQEEGWNPGLEDAHAFWQAESEGFFVAQKDDALVAAISVVNHTADFAFLGLYLARPEVRGQGIGYALWQHALAHAGTRTIGLDGVPAQQENYARSGFAHAGATTRFAGTLTAKDTEAARLARPSDVPALMVLEARASGVAKPAYLSHWFTEAETRKTLLIERDGAVSGFCTVRACDVGAKIGPLWADNIADARSLILQAATFFSAELSIDVPDSAMALRDLCATLGLQQGFETARMYRGPFHPPAAPIFAITSMELG